MNLLFRIVYAAHANGTHHKLALDALRYLTAPASAGWVRVFLRDAERFLEGSKAPDNEFRDFQNHVLHVRDGFWGGAMDAAETWYDKLVVDLREERWSDAVYTAGVLSHYVVDPIHPFHTAQSEAENNIHRAVEWSISKSYDDLRQIGEAGPPALELAVSDAPIWLRSLVCRGAEISNANYERLIAHYDMTRGVSDPPSGLDPVARAVVADLIVYASRSFAAVLDRAFAQSEATPPQVTLGAETVLAALKMPAKWLTKRLSDAADRKQVEAMYDELQATGRVEANLPADDRAVRELHRAQVLAPRVEAFEKQRAEAVAKTRSAPQAGTASPPAMSKPALTDPSAADAARRAGPEPRPAATAAALAPAAVPAFPPVEANPTLMAKLAKIGEAAPERAQSEKAGQIYLAETDDLEKAPSIGPRTAERFATIGIRTVGQFLTADPAATAKAIDARHITARDVADWQDQARLVLSISNLRGTHAQLLVGANYRTVAAVAEAAPEKLCADILAFAGTRDGQRLLRDGSPPDVARIKDWCEQARRALAA